MATTNINVTSTGYKTVKDESTALPQRPTDQPNDQCSNG